MPNGSSGITWLTRTGSWPSFSPDGTQIVYVRGGSLYTIPTQGGTPRLLYAPPPGQQATRPNWSWSPWIAFSQGSGNGQTIFMIRPDGEGLQPFPNQGELASSFYPSWFRDRQSIVVLEATNPNFLTLYQIFGDTPEEPLLLTPESDFCAGRPSVNPGGTAVAFAGTKGRYDQENNQIWIVPLPPAQPFQLDPRQGRSPNWSPDGNWILFESNRGTGPAGNYQLWIASAPGSGGPVIEPVPVTPADVYAQHGEWSRQQKLIVFDNAGRGEGIGIIAVPPQFG